MADGWRRRDYTGAAEYTYVGTQQYHGLVLVRVADGLVTHWREYQHVSVVPWNSFTEDTRFDGGSGGA